jgi:hypothetical protein
MNSQPLPRQPAGQEHEERLEAQRSQGDEDEHVEQRRRLEIERRRLIVLDVEAPDEGEQQRHVEHHRQRQHPGRHREAVGDDEPRHGEHEIDADGGNRDVAGGPGRLGRDEVEHCKGGDDRKLDPADEDLAAVLLGADGRFDALGQLRSLRSSLAGETC